jgi:hypothetical protein
MCWSRTGNHFNQETRHFSQELFRAELSKWFKVYERLGCWDFLWPYLFFEVDLVNILLVTLLLVGCRRSFRC